MFALKVFLIFVLFAASNKAKDFMKVYVKSVRCNFSEEFVHNNVTCFAKSYNRSFSTINISGVAKRPINQVFANVSLLFKYGTIYREVMHTPIFEVCTLLDENNFSNKMISTLLGVMNETSPGLIHKCPYQIVTITKCNVKLSSLTSVFPTGDYKMIFILTDNKDSLIFKADLAGSVLSSERNTFG